MRITAIRGCNLASLEGEFAIDFTVEPLLSAGIFAISGPTGAGKSTILDAMCLALFSKTPRTDQAKENNVKVKDINDDTFVQSDPRFLLRRGTASGYAEVDFLALNGHRYRARWSVSRAREKESGRMQNYQVALQNLDTGEEEQGKRTELQARITELIGLTFDQFTRSVLLAQNDFSTFLKAEQSEKASLLEKLTGTEHYSAISRRIFERNNEAKEAYEKVKLKIEGIELLPEEEEAALYSGQAAIEKTVEHLEKLRNERQALLDSIKAAEQAIANKQTEQKKANDRLIKAKEILATFQKTYTDAQLKQQELERAYKTIQPEIKEAEKLDIQVETEKKTVREALASLDKAKKEQAENETKQKQLTAWIEASKLPKELTSVADINKAIDDNRRQREKLVVEQTRFATSGNVKALRDKLTEGTPCPVCGSTEHPYASAQVIEHFVKLGEEIVALEQQIKQQTQLVDLVVKKNAVEQERKTYESFSEALRKRTAEAQAFYDEKAAALNKRQTERSHLLNGRPAEAVEKEFTQKTEQLKRQLDELVKVRTEQSGIAEQSKGVLEQISHDLNKASEELVKYRQAWDEWAAAHTPPEDAKPLDEQLSEAVRQKNENAFRLRKQEENKQKVAALQNELNDKRTISERWGKLNDLAGSADGAKFRRIAQGYTLDVLLNYANVQLRSLSHRYRLERVPDTLALQVVDRDLCDEVRTVHSLSGGESFLVSLALALGLSSLSSNRMKVESLFIDEGFGSLDADTLRIALDALENLRTQGRKIGVISHVQEMTERIPAQIKIVPAGNGKSAIQI